jgi:hypothetical protein
MSEFSGVINDIHVSANPSLMSLPNSLPLELVACPKSPYHQDRRPLNFKGLGNDYQRQFPTYLPWTLQLIPAWIFHSVL